jgi:hypothetical protein
MTDNAVTDSASAVTAAPALLKAVPAPHPQPTAEPPSPLDENAESGPRRLRITMEETTDQPADVRRLSKVLARLNAQPGELPVELMVRTRGGVIERLQLPAGIAPSEELIPHIRGLLGVLGNAGEVGDPAQAEVPGAASTG